LLPGQFVIQAIQEELVLGSRVGAPSPYPAALDRLARAILSLTSANGVWIAVARPGVQGGALLPLVAVGVHPAGLIALNPTDAPPVVRHVIDFAARDQYLVTSANLAADARFHGVETHPFGSIMCMPVHENGQPFVALVAARTRAEEFDERQRQFALVYAEQIAMTIHLLDAAAIHEAQARERAALLDATRALTSGLDARGVINSIANNITRVIACDAALIYRCDERAGVLRLVAGLGVDVEQLSGTAIPIQDQRSHAARVASERKARYNVSLPEDQAGRLTGKLAANGPAWLMCEPLLAQDRLVGVMMLARERAFDASEQRALGAFSALAAAALERVELFEETRSQRDQRNAMFASASDGFALIGDDLRVIEVNQAFASYLGQEPMALHGVLSCAALNGVPESPPSMQGCLLCHGPCRAKACLSDNTASGPFECAFPAPHAPTPTGLAPSAGPESGERTVSFTLTPIAGPAGRQVLLVGRDISDQRELERRRMEFLEMLAHEVRQPLQSVTTNLERALYYSPPDLAIEDRMRFERQALGAAQHVAAGITDLLTISQRDFGRFTVTPRPEDLSKVAQEAASELDALAKSFGVRLRVEAPEGLPLALIDLPRAKQVARNLLINALKFTPPNGWTRIATRVGNEDGTRWAVLEVTDSGVGIPKESLSRIFERRYQAPSPTVRGRPKGSGMGLAIVRFIMQGHGGSVTAESEPGQGSRFIARFPLA
jgi:GAF domain-containing protein